MIKSPERLSESFGDCAALIEDASCAPSIPDALELYSNEILRQFAASLTSILIAHYNIEMTTRKSPARIEVKDSEGFKGGTIHFIATKYGRDNAKWNEFLVGFAKFTNDFKTYAADKCVAIYAPENDKKRVVLHFNTDDMLLSLRALVAEKFRDHKSVTRNLNLIGHLHERIAVDPSNFKLAAKLH